MKKKIRKKARLCDYRDPLDDYPATKVICGDYKCDVHAAESMDILRSIGYSPLGLPAAPKGSQCLTCHQLNINTWVSRRLKESK